MGQDRCEVQPPPWVPDPRRGTAKSGIALGRLPSARDSGCTDGRGVPALALWQWDGLIVQAVRNLAEGDGAGLTGRLDVREHIGRPRRLGRASLLKCRGIPTPRDIARRAGLNRGTLIKT